MQTGKQFWITLFAMVFSAFIGYYANVYANKKNNELLVQLLKDQLVCVNNQIQNTTNRTSQEEMIKLIAQQKILEQQLQFYADRFNIPLS